MLDQYLVVDVKVLPEVFHKVIQVKNMLASGEVTQVSEAVKIVDISRSAYYKYKDSVFEASTFKSLEKKALLHVVVEDVKGVVSRILNELSTHGCNLLAINQNLPIQNTASVFISIDINGLTVSINELLDRITSLHGVSKLDLLSIE